MYQKKWRTSKSSMSKSPELSRPLDFQKENELWNINIKEELKEIPKVDENLLANQKFIDLDELDSDSYWKTPPVEQDINKVWDENPEEYNKEWQDVNSYDYHDSRIPQNNAFYSFEYEESI